MLTASTIRLERPSFGQFARQIAGLRGDQLEAGLELQRQNGGRLGEILLGQGLLTRDQLKQILRAQARWVAAALKADMGPDGFPCKTFLSMCMPAYNESATIVDTLDAAC